MFFGNKNEIYFQDVIPECGLNKARLFLQSCKKTSFLEELDIAGNWGYKLSTDEDSVSKILSVIAHPLRREILNFITDKGESSFTDLLNALQVDTGKLSFHLRTLAAFVEQTPNGKYKLSHTGENAVKLIRDVESWAEVADIQRKGIERPLASFRRRAYAFLIDFAIMLLISLILAIPEFLPALFGTVVVVDLALLPLVILGLLWVYSTLLEGFNGQTLGKRILGLKVIRTDGKRMSYDHAAVRNFGKAFLLPFDLLVGLKHETFMRYFDKFAGTNVIDLRA